MDYTVTRSKRDGVRADTHIPLDGNRRLDIGTWKSSRGLICNAQVVKVENGMVSFIMFGDYNKNLAHDRAARATETNVVSMHTRILAGIAGVIEDAKAFYAAKDAKAKETA